MTAWASSFSPTLIERLGWTLVHSVWQVAAVAVVAALVLKLLKHRSSQARYLAACLALLAMATVPIATFFLVETRGDNGGAADDISRRSALNPVPHLVQAAQVIGVEEPGARSPALDMASYRDARSRAAAQSRRAVLVEPLLPWLVIGWGVGVLVLSLRLLGGWAWIQWLVRRETRSVAEGLAHSLARLKGHLGIARTVRLLESVRVQVPLAIGWIRPVILLPVTAVTGLPLDQLEAILAHELAHIRRYDYLVNLVQSVVETLLFYHPGAWWISGRIREEREHCCDDWAVRVCGDRLTYARALATLEEQRGSGWVLAPSARDGSLLARVQRLLGAAAIAERPAGGLAGTLALMAVPLIGFTLFLAPAASQARAGVDDQTAIVGTVVSTDGRPVAGADVWLAATDILAHQSVTLARARTNEAGSFRLVAPAEQTDGQVLAWRLISAHKPGLGLARVAPAQDVGVHGFAPDRPVRLTLGAPRSATLRVIDHNGGWAVGAKVAVVFLDDQRSYLPDELSDRLAGRTDSEGKATVQIGPASLFRVIRVTTASGELQTFHFRDGFTEREQLVLQPSLPLEGAVKADNASVVRGLKVHLNTYHPDDHRAFIGCGEAHTVTDDHGRFRIPALARGRLSVSVQVPESSMYRAVAITDRELREETVPTAAVPLIPGIADVRVLTRPASPKTFRIEIPLKRLIHVHGVIVEKGTGKPIEGVGVALSSPVLAGGRLKFVPTDQEGRYEALALPGSQSYLHLSEPKAYLKRGHGVEIMIGEQDGLTLAPIELDRGVTLGGVVVDEAGNPVAAANVEGKWDRIYPANPPNPPGVSFGRTFSAAATTDAQGQFLLEGIHPGANVMLEASANDARTDGPTPAGAGTGTPAKLVISGANTVALVGRVVDAADQPIAGALVEIRSRPLKYDGGPDARPIRFDASEIRTDGDGRFRTSRQLKRGYGYRAEIQPVDETFMPESTPWLAFKADTRPFFPKVVLRRLRTVHGRVIDSRGRPVAGASVRQAGDGPAPTHDITDAEGRFALPGVLAGQSFVFVAKDGYRFEGKPLRPAEPIMEIVLTRMDEGFPKSTTGSIPVLSRTDELAVLHRLFDGYAERVIKEGGANELFAVLQILARLDVGRTTELLGDQRLGQWRPNNIRLSLAVRLMRESDQEARALIEAIPDANMRSYAYSEAGAALPESEQARKLSLLNDSLVAGRAVADPESRVLRLADIGGRLFDLGKTAEATNLVREAQATAVKLRTEGTAAWARGRLAEELAQVDLPAALDLLEATKEDRDHDKYLGRIAHELAGKNPAEAERVLMMMRDAWPHFRDEYTERVCYRMVAVDPKRAKALAAAIKKPRHRSRALGAMALAISRKTRDRTQAVQLCNEAFAVLEQAVASGTDDWDGLGMACTAGAGLLPIVEQVDGRLIPEYVMRTLALRLPIPGPMGREGISDIANALLASMIARYDRAIACQILDGFADGAARRRIGLEDWGAMFKGDEVFEAMALVDPARAAGLIDSLPESSGLSRDELKNTARLVIAAILARPEDERRRYVEQHMLHLWRIDSEEDEF